MSPLHSGILLLSYFSTGIIMPVLSLLLLSRGLYHADAASDAGALLSHRPVS